MIDFEIRALGGMTTAFDTKPEELRNLKSPVPIGDRIIELNVENARLRREIDYYKTLTNEVLHPLLAHVRFHTQGLLSAIQRLDAKIEEANARLTFPRPTVHQSTINEQAGYWKALCEQATAQLELCQSQNRDLKDLVKSAAESFDEQVMRNDILQMQLDQHKETMAEMVRDASDKDYVIAAQEFLLGAANDEVNNLGRSITEKNGLLAAFQALDQQDQTDQGQPQTKKRKIMR
ncbi:uncharacterized protein B0I36DRAFT_355996 [Microdochium trichocladiopsis]|uniref:Uncharacterized protein n=1 Tax=Microdochium trichocladiopsis TaxID=1682393 RepID=A0A9P8XR68_9PEZI|nr:uncharacterized protein B0I36DRAFT_355996 [Microdochium trichocladiopsis]KAH7012601.1 hypothetical protein B0I36DRAFT_355996 [Microdochium trichocladiopsis]